MVNEEELRKEYQIFSRPKEVVIEIPVRKHGESFLPDTDSNEIHRAVFRRMTVRDFWMIERFAQRTEEIDGQPIVDYDAEEMKKQILRFQLKEWSLPVPLEFDEASCLTDKCWEIVMKQPAPLIDAFVDEYQLTYIVTTEEEAKIDRQCSVLFRPNSRGVESACEAITLFCTLSGMWDKFGINRFDIEKLPYREYIMMRMVMHKELDSQKIRANTQKSKDAIRVAGPGGKTRPSRGITINNP